MSPHRSVVSAPPRSTATGPSRRSCLKLGIGGAALSLYRMRAPSAEPFGATAWLDGDYLVDDASRIAVATDYGGAVRRIPRAMVRARTAEDIGRVVAYANGSQIKVAMRGQGHSLSGQTLIDDGIVIDSTALNAVEYTSNDTLDVEAGALWGHVATAALARGRLPPVMPDAMMLSVGGTLSVGGSGETGFRFGAQVDHVRALDVVTGSGVLVSCVFGVEGDFDGASIEKINNASATVVTAGFNVNEPFHTNVNWLASIRGRLGYVWGRPAATRSRFDAANAA